MSFTTRFVFTHVPAATLRPTFLAMRRIPSAQYLLHTFLSTYVYISRHSALNSPSRTYSNIPFVLYYPPVLKEFTNISPSRQSPNDASHPSSTSPIEEEEEIQATKVVVLLLAGRVVHFFRRRVVAEFCAIFYREKSIRTPSDGVSRDDDVADASR